MSETHLSIHELAAQFNKELGGEYLIVGSEARQDVPRLTTGVLGFDLATGGGWAKNQWNEIVGPASSGKTALCYQTIAANQRLNPDFLAMWVAAEEYVPSYAQMFGVDTERLWVVETNAMEKALNVVLKAVENRAVDMVVIDSIPALVPTEEVEKAMDENATMALPARLLGKFFRKSANAQRRSLVEEDRGCTMIAINQWRDNVGVMYGDPRTTPGGKAKDYFYFVRLEMKRDDWITEGSKIEDRVGQVIKVRTLKNKTYRPHQTAEVDFYFADTKSGAFKGGDFDVVKDVVMVAVALDLISRKGAWFYYGDDKWNGLNALVQGLREQPRLMEELADKAKAAVFGEHQSLPVDEDEWDGEPAPEAS